MSESYMEIAAVVLAAGRGERMGVSGAKVLEPILGKGMLDWVLGLVERVGIGRSFVVVGYQAEQVKSYLKGRTGIQCIHQAEPLGSADAVRAVVPYLRTFRKVLVLCGDTPLFRVESLRRLISEHKRQKNVATFLSAQVPDPLGYGRVVRENGRVKRIVEEREVSEGERWIREINSGAYLFDRKVLSEAIRHLPLSSSGEFYLTDLIRYWADQGLPVNGVQLSDYQEGWGVNSFEELVRATGVLKNRILDLHHRQGVIIIDPLTTYIAEEVVLGKGTVIYPYTVIESKVTIGKECHIGPFAHIRPGSRLESGAEIGNFVEVTRSHIGIKTKAKHLSYLGDAVIGARVNIGAGTITANYDGKQKHQTVIDDFAMIGSHTTLIAPVRIGKRAVTGAGSVVTKKKNVPPGSVVAGVPAKRLKI